MDTSPNPDTLRLPLELIIEIVLALAPANPDAIIPATDDITKTLLSLTRVCKATYIFASKLIRQHCMYIDSNAKARALARCLEYRSPSFLHRSQSYEGYSYLRGGENLYLSPFVDVPKLPPLDQSNGETEALQSEDDPSDGTQAQSDDDDDSSSTSTESLWAVTLLNDLPTAEAVREILLAMAPTLRRLVIDIPLRTLWSRQDQLGVRPVLREGFEALIHLEDFTSVQDELFLDILPIGTPEPEVWATCWPKLRRLSLYNIVLAPNDNTWSHMARLPHLETVVFPKADAGIAWNYVDVKRHWLAALSAQHDEHADWQRSPNITIVLADMGPPRPRFAKQLLKTWRELDPENKVHAVLFSIPSPPSDQIEHTSSLGYSDIPPEQAFVKNLALQGTLWHDVLADMETTT